MLTLQQVFDKAALHLIQQNARSVKTEICVYRNPEGLKCAVGALIDDDKYLPKFDQAQTTAGILYKCDPQFRQALRESGVDYNLHDMQALLRSLQGLHDVQEVEKWGTELYRLAQRKGLDPKVVQQFKPET